MPKRRRKSLKELAEHDPGSVDFLNAMMMEAADECDALLNARRRFEEDEEDPAQISTRRVQSLKLLSDIYFQKSKSSSTLDIRSPEMGIVIKSIFQKIKMAMTTLNYEADQIRDFFKQLDQEMEGWDAEIIDHLEAFKNRAN